MSGDETQGKAKRTPWTAYLLVALIATVAGFVAVYVNFGSNGNVTPSIGRIEAPPVANRPSLIPVAGGPFAGLNTGAMANFLVHSTPKPVPDFKFNDGDGNPITLEDWRGKVVLLNLWATWCAPCRHEMPSLDRLKAELGGDDFDVVAISIDRAGIEKPKAFLEKIATKDLALYHDPSGKLAARLKAFGMPTTLLIGRNGEELGRLIGPAEWDAPEAVALMRAALAENKKEADQRVGTGTSPL